MPAARLGPKSPLPALGGYRNASSAALPDQEPTPQRDWMDKGHENAVLPYRLQDDYDRVRTPRQFKTAVLENEILRATFMLEYNARLWSLIHKPTGRELLYANPVFQPGNVAIRNAWITGGVEWNISTFGHSVLTLSPLFTAEIAGPDGSPGLRAWEYERSRRIVFQIDFFLPPASPFLLVRPRIVNPHDQAVPMYWWSNIAVTEREDVRVVVPANDAYRHAYDGKMTIAKWPEIDGVDCSYTARRQTAADAYFRIPTGQRPWMATIDGDGRGLVHASTSRLVGRKMWNWGIGQGSRRWQNFLSSPESPGCLEVQAGLAPTQSQYVPMPPKAQWEWLEAYGLIEADPKQVHGEWSAAHRYVDAKLRSILPADQIERQLAATAPLADRPPGKVLIMGSGWGALETERRATASEPALPGSTPFPEETLGEDQAQWLELLRTGALPERPVDGTPGAFMTQPEFHRLLEESVAAGKSDHWLGWYHLGVMRWRAGDKPGATAAWETSVKRQRTPWALRDLAVAAQEREELTLAAALAFEAARMCPNLTQMMVHACQACSYAKRPADVLKLLEMTTPAIRANGRLRYLEALAALELGRLDIAKTFFDESPELASVREAELSLSDLWFDYHAQRLAKERGVAVTEELKEEVRETLPPPAKIDFRMHGRPKPPAPAAASPTASAVGAVAGT